MNKYESMFIVKTTIDEETVKNTVENFKSVITEMGGEIIDLKDLGQKRIAYPIKKEITGFYYVVNFNASKEAVAELDRKAKIDENILRHLIIRLESE